jgi:SAM-dependent methyltransferase
MDPDDARAEGYADSYREFDSPLFRRLRSEAYGEDIGQHSWVTADELRADVGRLGLSAASRLVDLGCGPCGPLTFVLASIGCAGTGLELSSTALRIGRARAASLGVASLLTVYQCDLNDPLAFGPDSFDAAVSLDVVCHIRDRAEFFREVARVLSPRARVLFTDPCVLTGSISSDEVRLRSVHGYTRFVAHGWNETALESAGLRLLETEDRTVSVISQAGGRLAALRAHRGALIRSLSAAHVAQQQAYLETVVELAQRRALSRTMYLAEVGPPRDGSRRVGGL